MNNQEILSQFRETLKSLDILEGYSYLLKSDNFLLRALKQNRFNLKNSTEQMRDYVKMRKKYNPEEILQETFPKEFTDTFTIQLGGFDFEGRPIALIPSVRTWKLKETLESGQEELFVRYMMKWTFSMEKIVLERDVDYGILVVDATDCLRTAFVNSTNKKSVQLTLRLFDEAQKACPGVINQIFIGNGPKILNTLFTLAISLVNLPADIQFLSAMTPQRSWTDGLKKYIPPNGISPHFNGVCTSFIQI